MPVALSPIEPCAADVILVGDPRRAFALAQELMVQPRMSHQARGLWGYTGETRASRPLTVQSTGAGGPGAATVSSGLLDQGARRLVRMGTCVALDGSLQRGDTLLVERAICADGTSRLITGGLPSVEPDPALMAALAVDWRRVTISSHDLGPGVESRLSPESPEQPPKDNAAVARDLQTATVLALAHRRGVPAAAVLVVAEDVEGVRLGEDRLWEIFRREGSPVVQALA